MSGTAMDTLGTPERSLQFKVTLVTGAASGAIAPWRRVLLPADVSLYELGDALSDAMGWEGMYLFRYFIDGHMTPDYHGGEYLDDIQNLPVRDVLDDDVTTFEYEYDIGEEVRGGVMHVVEFEGETEATFAKEDAPQIAPGATRFRPICVAGEHRCEMEDVDNEETRRRPVDRKVRTRRPVAFADSSLPDASERFDPSGVVFRRMTRGAEVVIDTDLKMLFGPEGDLRVKRIWQLIDEWQVQYKKGLLRL